MTGQLLWYAAYGSNLHLARLTAYLAGGRPPGGARAHPGCRDPRPPRATRPIQLPGQLYFALESTLWTGGMAFYDPLDPGLTPARAYLLTAEQFADLAAQEMHRAPGTDLDLRPVLSHGRATLGPGRYETLVHPGDLEGLPLLTLTAPWRTADAPLARPALGYLHHLAAGLHESHAWPTPRSAAYLSTRPGAAGHWTAVELTELLG
ncbi:histone deacetylase [Kitasatospora sp. NBC_01266]|uniref:histone deacetylase n=1 Tax=Kitasatospora sp. NBC_01266 TaxID=2903572 RepID=UPI002E2EFA6A|nr:histone deacetylase [Kitasatospora sp. NBC_01266]